MIHNIIAGILALLLIAFFIWYIFAVCCKEIKDSNMTIKDIETGVLQNKFHDSTYSEIYKTAKIRKRLYSIVIVIYILLILLNMVTLHNCTKEILTNTNEDKGIVTVLGSQL